MPAFASAEMPEEAVRAAEAIGHPVVLKPVSGSGSIGVRLCRDAAETRAWAERLLDRGTDERGNPVTARLLVEAAVRGPEFSVETFDDTVVTVVAKHTGPEPYFVETGHDVPAAGPGRRHGGAGRGRAPGAGRPRPRLGRRPHRTAPHRHRTGDHRGQPAAGRMA